MRLFLIHSFSIFSSTKLQFVKLYFNFLALHYLKFVHASKINQRKERLWLLWLGLSVYGLFVMHHVSRDKLPFSLDGASPFLTSECLLQAHHCLEECTNKSKKCRHLEWRIHRRLLRWYTSWVQTRTLTFIVRPR